jgi:phenylacetate-CoA ligase
MADLDSKSTTTEAKALAALQGLVSEVVPHNPFYGHKFAAIGCSALPASLADFTARYPFTTKAELVADQAMHPPYGTNLTYPLARYTRCHQTSGTTGAPLRWLDTPECWAAMTEDWEEVFRSAGVKAGDRAFFAFSFGPFLGFWLAFEAAQKLGCLSFAGGGMSSALRARVLLENECTVLCGTPTYVLHLAEVARAEGLDLSRSRVRRIIVAGEPGGSQPATRARIREAWNGAEVFDHHGMTEVGPVTHEVPGRPGTLAVMARSYFAEVIQPATGEPVPDGTTGELVLTTLRRTGSPLIRYRTGDLVRGSKFQVQSGYSATEMPAPWSLEAGTLCLEGGILGRADDMVIVRGVNVYPGALDEIIRSLPEIAEYRVTHDTSAALAALSLEIEAPSVTAKELEERLHLALSLRIPVTAVEGGSLPRFELKAKRWRKLVPSAIDTPDLPLVGAAGRVPRCTL